MTEIYDPLEFYGLQHEPAFGPRDPQQRRALLLVAASGNNVGFGGADLVAFVSDQVVIASVMPQTHELNLMVDGLDEFVARASDHLRTEIGAEEFAELMAP